MSNPSERWLSAAFFVSGTAALLFETLWFRQAALAVGSTVWASSIVLATFMAGLALGSALAGRLGARLARPLRLYAALELVIAASGVGAVLAFPLLGELLAPWFLALTDAPAALAALRLTLAAALLLLPATAMGATLPLLVRTLAAGSGAVIGRLYGWNTLGAVYGSFLAESVAIERLGLRGAGLLAGGLDLGVALGVLLLLARAPAPPSAPGAELDAPERPDRPRLDRAAWATLLAAALAGATMLALEVVWLRLALVSVFGTSPVFAAILGVVLLGIGLGGLLAGAALRRFPAAGAWSAALAAAAGAALALAYRVQAPLVGAASAWLPSQPLTWQATFHAAPLLPVSLASGALFALLGADLGGRLGDAGRGAGLVASANTLGAIAGALLGGFALLPGLGVERSCFLLALCWAPTAALLLRPAGLGPRGRGVHAGLGLGLLLLLVAFPHGRWEAALRAPRPGQEVLLVREGLNETIRVTRELAFGQPVALRLWTNSHSMSSTSGAARRYMQLYAWWPMAVHPRLERALLISFGCGSTARALTDVETLARIDVVDPSREILSLSPLFQPGRDPLQDPRVRVHREDGRFFLATRQEERWDLITSEPPPPLGAGVVSLYTQEYFQLLRARLAPGGMCTYWLPAHALGHEGTLAVIAAFLGAFPDASLWHGVGLDLMLVGTREASGPVSAEHFERAWRRADLLPELVAVGLDTPEQLGATFLFDAEDLRALVAGVEPVTDDRPARLGPMHGPSEQLRSRIQPWLQVDRARARFERSPLVARLWPEALRRSTPPAFALRRTFVEPRAPELELDELDRLVAAGGPRLFALQLLQTSVDELRALERALEAGRPVGSYEAWCLAAGAIVDGRWAEAAQHLERARDAPPEARAPLLAWTLARAGQLEAARAVPRAGSPRAWAWLDRELLAAPGGR